MKTTVLKMLKDLKPECDFEGSKDYIEDEFLDSFDILTLISEIEEEFDCYIDPMDILAENFQTADSICSLIEKSR